MKKIPVIVFILIAIPAMYVFATGYQLQVSIPQGGGSNIAKGTELNNISEYIKVIYNFSLFAVGIIALFAFVIGAIEFTISAGFVSRRGDAQDKMMQAIFGLLLLLAAAIIFNTINPVITEVREPAAFNPSHTTSYL